MNITNDKEDAVRRGCILFASRIFISDVTEKLSACDLHFYYTWADILKTGVHESDFDEKERIWPEALI